MADVCAPIGQVDPATFDHHADDPTDSASHSRDWLRCLYGQPGAAPWPPPIAAWNTDARAEYAEYVFLAAQLAPHPLCLPENVLDFATCAARAALSCRYSVTEPVTDGAGMVAAIGGYCSCAESHATVLAECCALPFFTAPGHVTVAQALSAVRLGRSYHGWSYVGRAVYDLAAFPDAR